ncbi:MAG: HAMP domain-containing histidine kinase [Lachnospiraceae bacterium]|nr:HAMP domain-containing histidine kinase [Lachnospiraceae bacterium]
MKKLHLRTTMSLVFALLVAITVCLVSILSSTFISRGFEDYVKLTQKKQADDLVRSIGSHYDESGGGFNIDYVHGMGMYALKDGFIIRLYDEEGKLLWDAENHDMALCHEVMDTITLRMQENRPELNGDFVTYSYDLEDGEKQTGKLEISYYTPYYMDENDFRFIHVLNRILSLAGGVSLLVAALLGVLFARRITKPISGVIAATKKISEGDYGVRVDANLKERETYELADAVNHMAASLEEQEYLRRQLTGDIAHELRTPVTNISSYMEMMIDDVMEPTQERLKSCYDELSRLSGLITDLERLESAESGRIDLNKEDVELLGLSKTILKGFETGAREKNIDARISGEEVHICADRGRISQVIANLLSNALKYTDENGRITVSVKGQKNNAELVVEDTGIGISKDEQDRVFERFYRTDKSRTRKTGGAGIGLSITKAIVQAHGGTITCESEPGTGSKFIVTLPRTRWLPALYDHQGTKAAGQDRI